jgi:hypothetical protein
MAPNGNPMNIFHVWYCSGSEVKNFTKGLTRKPARGKYKKMTLLDMYFAGISSYTIKVVDGSRMKKIVTNNYTQSYYCTVKRISAFISSCWMILKLILYLLPYFFMILETAFLAGYHHS